MFEPIYDHWFDMLEKEDNFSEVADWLNEQGVPVLSVDLHVQPQREAYRERIVSMRRTNPNGPKKTEKTIAAELGITITASQRAAALQRRMDKLGLIDPYLPVLQLPDDVGRMRRHKHLRYAFEPLPYAGQF